MDKVKRRLGVALRDLVAIALLVAGAACTTLHTPATRDADGCHAWWAQLDAAVAAAGVRDAESEPIAAFPGLRVDRVGMALRARMLADPAARSAWLERAAQLDRSARAAEIANLPASAFPLGGALDRDAANARTERCRARTVLALSTPPVDAASDRHHPLADRATVPARYNDAARALGLYPLVRWPFLAGVRSWQREQLATMAQWAFAPPPLQHYAPPPAAAPSWADEVDALGLPRISAAREQQLLAGHAPVFAIETRAPSDRFGAPRWQSGRAPRVDSATPVVYQRITHTRLDGRWLLQLVYTLWFPERPARSPLDLLAGMLDGVIVRLTLDVDGQVLLLDTIHACGCYHMFFPAASLQPRAEAPSHEEWMFAPAALPTVPPGQRLRVHIAAAAHYVMGVDTVGPGVAPDERYGLRDEQDLRSLPGTEPGRRRSLYAPDGLVVGSERGERFLFWPMGIASAGAMRQWGHHATAFVGSRHFDDPDLIEHRFVRVGAATGSD